MNHWSNSLRIEKLEERRLQACSLLNAFVFAEAATGSLHKKVIFKSFAKFTGKHLCQSLFFLIK